MATLLCANIDRQDGTQHPTCVKKATIVCTKCKLVQYCSKECRTSHWPLHKSACEHPMADENWVPQWYSEGRTPSYADGDLRHEHFSSYNDRKHLWGNVPAIDIMKMKDNEGVDHKQDLRLLFAASGDLRNVVMSISGLPEQYEGRCEVYTNDREFDVVARNVLLLLIANIFEPKAAHQSCFISVLPYILEVCSKISDRDKEKLFAKTWRFGEESNVRSLRLVLTKTMWHKLVRRFEVPTGMSKESALEAMRTAITPESGRDFVDRAMYAKLPYRRVAEMRFKESGVLVPFGSSVAESDTPNPTLFDDEGNWAMMDDACPLAGWSFKQYLTEMSAAENDVYGALHHYLLEILQKFCAILQSRRVEIHMSQLDAMHMQHVLKIPANSFDRIEISNTPDAYFLGPHLALTTFSPLLKTQSINKHAAMIFLFVTACSEVATPHDEMKDIATESRKVSEYLDLNQTVWLVDAPQTPFPTHEQMQKGKYNPEMNKHNHARMLFRDFTDCFERYLREVRVLERAREMNVQMKEVHSIVEKWPFGVKDGDSQLRFDMAFAMGRAGERYVEWRSII